MSTFRTFGGSSPRQWPERSSNGTSSFYGTAATLVFNKIFFAKGVSDLDAILAAFVTYAVGFAARPLGGVVFGHFGDRYGRKKLLHQPAARRRPTF